MRIYRVQNNLNDIVHWFIGGKGGSTGGLSFQTMYIYSDVWKHRSWEMYEPMCFV